MLDHPVGSIGLTEDDSGTESRTDFLRGQALFGQWADGMVALGEFDESTVQTYRTIWHAWLAWLAARGLSWQQADGVLVRLFLEGPSPGLVHHRPALLSDRMALYTRQRYWRVLRAVYDHAAQSREMTSNPVLEVADVDRPKVALASRQSQVLPAEVLALLRDAEAVEACLPCSVDPGSRSAWIPLRDRALVLVLAHLGITTREVMMLRGRDVMASVDGETVERSADGAPPSPALVSAESVSALDAHPLWLEVSRDEELIPRTLELAGDVRQVLLPWLVARRSVLRERLGRRQGSSSGTTFEQQLDRMCLSEPLFLSRQRSQAQIAADRSGGVNGSTSSASSLDASLTQVGLLPPMEASNVYVVVKRVLDAVYALPDLAGQHPRLRGLNQASGAAIVRNSVLQDWVRRFDEETAAIWGGLRTAEHLKYRLVGTLR